MILRILEREEENEILRFLEKRFGFERRVFSGLEFLANPKGKVFAVNRQVSDFAGRERIACLSLPFVRMGKTIKPTSVMIQFFGRHAKKNVIELREDEAREFVKGSDLSVETSCPEGYVILKYGDYPLGCGLLKGGIIKNMLPKAKRMPVEFL